MRGDKRDSSEGGEVRERDDGSERQSWKWNESAAENGEA
jgi:hypothetical protein